MDIGELSSKSAGPKVSAKELSAEILELTFVTPVKVAVEGQAVQAPHWKKGENLTDPWGLGSQLGVSAGAMYSKRPAAYLVKDKGADWKVEVKVKITSKNVSGNCRIVGRLGTMRIEGSCPAGSGEHTVSAVVASPPVEMQHWRGEITWSVEAPGVPACIGMSPTAVEIYFLLDQPISVYDKSGVWAEALRLVFSKAMVAGLAPVHGLEVAARITKYCHSVHGLRYDTVEGGSSYGVGLTGGNFDLKGYLIRKIPTVNCYDQAAAVQSLCGSLGVKVAWIAMEPYGFINQTMLVGNIGPTNNPFYESNGSPMLIDPNNRARQAFGNHAFCGFPADGFAFLSEVEQASAAVVNTLMAGVDALTGTSHPQVTLPENDGKILDACAGPRCGTETCREYINDNIDHDTTLNALYGDLPGTIDAMDVDDGVAKIKPW